MYLPNLSKAKTVYVSHISHSICIPNLTIALVMRERERKKEKKERERERERKKEKKERERERERERLQIASFPCRVKLFCHLKNNKSIKKIK